MKILSAENFYVRTFIYYSLPILVIGIISRTFPITGPFYYSVPVLLITNIFLAFVLIPRSDKIFSYIPIIFVFPIYCLITSFWSIYPIISIQRSLYLLLLYSGILSTVLLYRNYFPDKGLGFLIPANVVILVLSVISLVFGIPVDRWTGGNGLGFMGFAGHQNILAAALLFTLPGTFTLVINDQRKLKSKVNLNRIFFWLLLIANCSLLILTYSRAAILSLCIGIITYLIISKSKKILAILFSLTIILIVLYFTVSPFQNVMYTLLNKDGGKLLDRRTVLWEPSLNAAELGSFFGLGYGVSAPNIKTPLPTGSHYENGRYIREKGNSVLAVIEETGLFGLLLFLLPLIWVIRKFTIQNSQLTIKEKSKNNYTFYIFDCALVVMIIHAQFEGWWVGVGSIHLPIFLLLLLITFTEGTYSKN